MRTVLVVDDEAALAEIVSQALADAGYRTEIAWNGREGLEKALEQPPDLIITDLMMPVMDGWELCEAIQSNARLGGIPLVIMTATPGHRNQRNCRHAALLSKPFDIHELLGTVAAVLEGDGAGEPRSG